MQIWHNPRCSKSREALKILEEKGAEFEVFKYLDEDIDRATLEAVLKKLGIKAHDLIRTKEAIYKELGLSEAMSENALLEAMIANPKLIERPIIIDEDKAVIGRPPEKVVTLL